MRAPIIAACLVVMSVAVANAADPAGTYAIKGTNPGNKGSYSGTATVTKTGETYRVVWVVGGSRYVGTGIGNKDFISVAYKSDSSFGLALYGADGGNWAGVWTYSEGREVGTETWMRQ